VNALRQALARWWSPAAPLEPVSRLFGVDRGTPIDRRYIEQFLGRHAAAIRGDVLEVGDDGYTRRFGGAAARPHRLVPPATAARPGSPVVEASLEEPGSLPEGRFDCFVCTQTYNFVFEIGRAVESSHRLLKPGGWLLATAAAIAPISRYDMDRWGDYWRLTQASAQRLLAPWFGAAAEVVSYGNAFAATCFVRGMAVEDVSDPALLDPPDGDYPVIVAMAARKAAP